MTWRSRHPSPKPRRKPAITPGPTQTVRSLESLGFKMSEEAEEWGGSKFNPNDRDITSFWEGPKESFHQAVAVLLRNGYRTAQPPPSNPRKFSDYYFTKKGAGEFSLHIAGYNIWPFKGEFTMAQFTPEGYDSDRAHKKRLEQEIAELEAP